MIKRADLGMALVEHIGRISRVAGSGVGQERASARRRSGAASEIPTCRDGFSTAAHPVSSSFATTRSLSA